MSDSVGVGSPTQLVNDNPRRWAVRFKGEELKQFDNWNDAWAYRQQVLIAFMREIMTPPAPALPEVIHVGGDA